MNKKLIVTGIAVLVVATAGGYAARTLMHQPTAQKSNNTETSTTAANTPTSATSSTSQPVNQDILSIQFTPITPVEIPGQSFNLITNPNIESHLYKVGVVNTGYYKGGDVLLLVADNAESGSDMNAYHIINQNGKLSLIANNSDDLRYDNDTLDRTKFIVDTNSTISSLIFPEQIVYKNIKLVLSSNTSSTFFSAHAYDLKLVFTDPIWGDVYTDTPSNKFVWNGFYLRAPDGTLRTYSLDIPFHDKNHNIPAVIWSDGYGNTAEYMYTDRGGCGSQNYASVVSGVTTDDLALAGTTSTGDPVYVLKDPNNAILKKIYADDYNPYNGPKISYDAFIAAKPAFFWFDGFGRLIKFEKADFIPQAECGKPVIYLYPTKAETVSVHIDPVGGLTKSDPPYDGGWSVTATPDSRLTDMKTGAVYPYLFWEGRGGIYATPRKGFMVAANGVHNFLTEKLTMLGLNTRERTDFMDFWEPRMTGAPYFFVTFLGTSAMDTIAPLTISPKPDTVIRILMDFTPLQAPETVQGYTITTPQRRGFTVVEWGGVLR